MDASVNRSEPSSASALGAAPPKAPRGASPWAAAVAVAVVYVVYSLAYIFVSGRLAARWAGSVEELERIEALKGTGFVIVTGVGLGGLVGWALRRLRRHREQLDAYYRALIDAERRATAGLYAASIAHDMRNILTIVGHGVQVMSTRPELPADEAELARDTAEGVRMLADLSERLLALGRQELPGAPQDVDLVLLMQGVVELGRSHKALKFCRLSLEAPSRLEARVNPVMFRQMLLNLIVNAGEAVAGRGEIRVVLTARNGEVVLETHDNGPGVPPELEQRVFDPLFTTKPGGTGLGLATVRAFAEVHGGRVALVRSPLGGACFRVRWPARAPLEGRAS